MTQKEELLSKDLCARIYYKVRCSFGVDDAVYEITGINPTGCGASEIQATHIKSGINGDFKINSCKPYLFPLSSMTEEQIEKLKEELCNMYDPYHDYDSYENWGVEVFEKHIHSDNYKFTFTTDVTDWLNKNHFDYRGLISMGLAIDATGLNIY